MSSNIFYNYISKCRFLRDGAGTIAFILGLNLFLCIGQAQADVNYFIYNAPNRGIVQLVSSSSTVNNAYTYDSFGNVKTSTENAANVYKYDGEQLEKESNIIYLRNRYYDSSTGRFITKDFFRGAIQDPCTINNSTRISSVQEWKSISIIIFT